MHETEDETSLHNTRLLSHPAEGGQISKLVILWGLDSPAFVRNRNTEPYARTMRATVKHGCVYYSKIGEQMYS